MFIKYINVIVTYHIYNTIIVIVQNVKSYAEIRHLLNINNSTNSNNNNNNNNNNPMWKSSNTIIELISKTD